jgi:hypothetical protein
LHNVKEQCTNSKTQESTKSLSTHFATGKQQWSTTKPDILHVMRLLGHKNIKNTHIYTQLVTFQNDDYSCKVATNIKEAAELIEVGYEYICEMDNQKLFRKRK